MTAVPTPPPSPSQGLSAAQPPALTLVTAIDPDAHLVTLRALAAAVTANPRSVRTARMLADAVATMDNHLSSAGSLPGDWKSTVRTRRRMLAARQAHARASDPSTSHAAAASITSAAMRARQQAVLTLLAQIGPSTHQALALAYEAAHRQNPTAYPRQAVSGVRTRVSELVDLGLVRDTGRKALLPSNRRAIVWAA